MVASVVRFYLILFQSLKPSLAIYVLPPSLHCLLEHSVLEQVHSEFKPHAQWAVSHLTYRSSLYQAIKVAVEVRCENVQVEWVDECFQGVSYLLNPGKRD